MLPKLDFEHTGTVGSALVTVFQRNRAGKTYIDTQVYAGIQIVRNWLMWMETEKPHYLPSTNQRPRKAGGVIHSECKGPRTRGTYGINPSARAADEMSCPSSTSEAGKQKIKLKKKKVNSSSLQPSVDWFVLRAFSRLVNSTYTEQDNLLSPLIQKLISSGHPYRHSEK